MSAPRHGDFGWIVSRHAALYAQEYCWHVRFEGPCAQIVVDFIIHFDAAGERCWIAERNSKNVGCVMPAKGSEKVARLLLVEPRACGLGLGTPLIDECLAFARANGYRRITLWTHRVLTAARHTYEKAGFTLTTSEPQHSGDQNGVAKYWDADF